MGNYLGLLFGKVNDADHGGSLGVEVTLPSPAPPVFPSDASASVAFPTFSAGLSVIFMGRASSLYSTTAASYGGLAEAQRNGVQVTPWTRAKYR